MNGLREQKKKKKEGRFTVACLLLLTKTPFCSFPFFTFTFGGEEFHCATSTFALACLQ